MKRTLHALLLSALLALGGSGVGVSSFASPIDDFSQDTQAATLSSQAAIFCSHVRKPKATSERDAYRRVSPVAAARLLPSLPLPPPRLAGQDLLHFLTLQRK